VITPADGIEHLRQESRVIGPRLRRDLAPLVLRGEEGAGTRGDGGSEELRVMSDGRQCGLGFDRARVLIYSYYRGLWQ